MKAAVDVERLMAAGWYEAEGGVFRDVSDFDSMPHKAKDWADAQAQMDAPDWARYLRPDEVAETWDGVFWVEGLYAALWGLMDDVPPIPNLEDSGPHDHVGHGNLAQFWGRLSEEHRQALERLHG